MTTTLCNSGNVIVKAGVDATALTDAQYTQLINEAESLLTADTGVNWVDAWPVISGNNFAQIITGAVSARAAIPVIQYDPLALGPLAVATTKVNVCLDEYDRAVSKLKDANVYKPFGGGTYKLTE